MTKTHNRITKPLPKIQMKMENMYTYIQNIKNISVILK